MKTTRTSRTSRTVAANGETLSSAAQASGLGQLTALSHLALSGASAATLFEHAARFLAHEDKIKAAIFWAQNDKLGAPDPILGWGWEAQEPGVPDDAHDMVWLEEQTFLSGTPIAVTSLKSGESPTQPSAISKHGIVSALCVSVQGRGGLLGALSLYWTHEHNLPAQSIQRIEGIANIIAQAVEIKNLEVSLRREVEENSVLADIGRIIGSSLHINEVYEKFAHEVRRLIPWDRITVTMLDGRAGSATIAYVAGIRVEGREVGTKVDIRNVPGGDVVWTRSGLFINVDEPATSQRRAAWLQAGLHSALYVPLIWRDRPIGTLTLMSRSDAAYSWRDVAVAERIGAQVAGAIANARLYGDLQKRAEETDAISEIGRIALSSLQWEDIQEQIATLLRRLIPCDLLEIAKIDPKTGHEKVTFSSDTSANNVPVSIDHLKVSPARFSQGVRIGTVRKQLPSASTAGNPASPEGQRVNTKFQSWMQVPLHLRGEVTGAISFYSHAPDFYSEREVSLAEQAAQRILSAIASSDLYAALKQEATERVLLAELPQLGRPGIELRSLLDAIVERIKPVIPFDVFTVTTVDAVGNEVKLLYLSSGMSASPVENSSWPRSGSVTEAVMRSMKGLLHDLPPQDQSYKSPVNELLHGEAGMPRSAMSVPLVGDSESIAVLNMYAPEGWQYSERNLQFAEQIGERIAPMLAFAVSRTMYGVDRETFHFTASPHRNGDQAWALKGDGASEVHGRAASPLEPPSILVVDSQTMCRRGIMALFRGTHVRIADDVPSFEDALAKARLFKPNVLLYDVHQGDPDYSHPMAAMRAEMPNVRLLFIADSASRDDLLRTLRAGAAGFLLKTVTPSGLINAVERIHQGGTVVDPDLLSTITGWFFPAEFESSGKERAMLLGLSEKDRTLLSALSAGMSINDIATAFHITAGTARNSVTRLYRRIGVHNRTAAVLFATRAGLTN